MQSKPTVPLTLTAYTAAEAKVVQLNQEIAATIVRLQEAREQGDLSENGAYKYAKMELGSLRRQLGQVKHLLATSYVAHKSADSTVVGFGSTVTVNSGTDTLTYTIVSHHESNLTEGKLSFESPLGSAVFGKPVGAAVVVHAPRGEQTWKILQIA